MSESQGRDLKPPVDGMFYEIFGFGTFFRYHNFQNEIDAWESTVRSRFASVVLDGVMGHPRLKRGTHDGVVDSL